MVQQLELDFQRQKQALSVQRRYDEQTVVSEMVISKALLYLQLCTTNTAENNGNLLDRDVTDMVEIGESLQDGARGMQGSPISRWKMENLAEAVLTVAREADESLCEKQE